MLPAKMLPHNTILVLLGLSCLAASVAQVTRAQSYTTSENQCQPLERLQYKLFATKTSYEQALKYLRQLQDDDLAKPFEDDSLEEEHLDLVRDKCVPQVFYLIGRNAASFPNADTIKLYNEHLSTLVARMSPGSSSWWAYYGEQPALNSECQSSRAEFLAWRPTMKPGHSNQMTRLGALEELNIARRFKRLYPEFFNASRAQIHLGVTDKVRTAQTARAFLQEVDGLQLPGECGNFHAGAQSQQQQQQPSATACYKTLMQNYRRPMLEFHKQCDRVMGHRRASVEPRVARIKSPALKRPMCDRVARKLGLDNSGTSPPITPQVLDSIYGMCKLETAAYNTSIWCNLFSRYDIEALEFMEDTSTYIGEAYGAQAHPAQSCPLVKDLLETLEAAQRMQPGDPKRSYFHFTHNDAIQKLLATFELFRCEEGFSEQRIREFEYDLRTPKIRDWRTSMQVPFSANMAFVLYKCPGKKQQQQQSAARFKVLASVSEQPVKLGGCRDADCSLQRLFRAYKRMRACDLADICTRVRPEVPYQ